MITRRLGPDGLTVSAIGYGAMVLVHGMYGVNDDEQSRRTVQHAIDAGATLIDTSDAYGPDGHNERLVGQAIAGRRDEVQIATKWGVVRVAVVTRRDARRAPHYPHTEMSKKDVRTKDPAPPVGMSTPHVQTRNSNQEGHRAHLASSSR